MFESDKIYKALQFLENYDFKSHINTDGRQCNVSFYNEEGCFTFHSYPQFGDIEIFISNNFDDYLNKKYINNYSMNWIVENALPVWKKYFSNKKFDIIELVSFFIKKEIENKNRFFGIKISENKL